MMARRWAKYRLYCDRRVGEVERWVYGDPRDMMRVPDPILASAAFLCVKKAGEVVPVGTTFVIEVESPTPGWQWHHRYLVTARHCVENSRRYHPLYLRVNQKGPFEPLLIELPNAWEYHADEVNDVAVLPYPTPPLQEVMWIEREALAIEKVIEDASIGIGDDLLIVGLFTKHHGPSRNHPIVRAGNIAAMPYEELRDPNSGLGFHAYLAEVRSIGGLSGSPVWVVLGPALRMAPNPTEKWFFLLGLVRGHWKKEGEWLADSDSDESESLNTGIAMVTPIQKALDIIDSEDLVKERKRIDSEHIKQRGQDQILDSAQPAPDSEYERFEDLTRKLVQTPKPPKGDKSKED